MSKPDNQRVTSELEYYLGRVPTDDEVQEAVDWMTENPGINLAEYVDAMMEAGLLS